MKSGFFNLPMMNPVLVLVKTDPMVSHKPVEALRIALGFLSGELPVQIVLMNRAPILLGEDAEDAVDGELLMKYLPSFKELGQRFYVEEEAWKALRMEPEDYQVELIPMGRIAELIQQANRLVAF